MSIYLTLASYDYSYCAIKQALHVCQKLPENSLICGTILYLICQLLKTKALVSLFFSLQEWNEKLALVAKERAASCHTDVPPQHSSSFGHIGWNAHLSAHGDASFSDIIDSWFEEGEDFIYSTGKCRENASCQHYTQVYQRADTHCTCVYAEFTEIFICVC